LNLIAYGRAHGNYHGQSFTVFLLTVAACEAAIALVLFLALYQRSGTLDVSVWRELGETVPDETESEPAGEEASLELDESRECPVLSPAGREPSLQEAPASRKETVAHG
jgi:NADH-quinone oxidoreductase subunit K